MAFDPTGQLGLPQDLTYELLTPSQSGFAEPVQVVVATNPARPTSPPRAFWRGLNGGLSWGQVGAAGGYMSGYIKDTTLGTWRPAFVSSGTWNTTHGHTYYPIEERFIGTNFNNPMCVSYAPASLKDGVTAYAYCLWGGIWWPDVIMRYDTGLAGETGGVWRLSNWAKTYGYDVLPPAESGFANYDVFIPYVTASLAVGTTATGYYRAAAVGSALTSTGVTYTCTQVTPTHKWSHP
jgi:hypothetical protein